MTIYTPDPNSAKPDKDQSTGCTITAVALLCVTVALPSGSAIGQSQIVPFHSGRAIGHALAFAEQSCRSGLASSSGRLMHLTASCTP
jgi:hypothetical protein